MPKNNRSAELFRLWVWSTFRSQFFKAQPVKLTLWFELKSSSLPKEIVSLSFDPGPSLRKSYREPASWQETFRQQTTDTYSTDIAHAVRLAFVSNFQSSHASLDIHELWLQILSNPHLMFEQIPRCFSPLHGQHYCQCSKNVDQSRGRQSNQS